MRAWLLLPIAVMLLAACGTTPAGSGSATGAESSGAASPIASPSGAAVSSSGPASAGATAVAVGSCGLLTVEDIEDVLGVPMPEGVATFD